MLVINGCLILSKKVSLALRDGRTLIGVLRAIDQFANLVLHGTVERIHVDGYFGDIPRGIFVVRGNTAMSPIRVPLF